MNDRRIIRDRRIVARGRHASEMTESMVIVIVPPEARAAQVERVYNAIHPAQREAAGLTYEHVRLTLDAMRG